MLMTLTVEATKKSVRVTLAVVLALLGLAVVALWPPGSSVGKSGTVTMQLTPGCGNAGDIRFDGSSWTPEATAPLAPESWTTFKQGRFTIRTPNTGEFVSEGDHFSITYHRTPKGSFSPLHCTSR